MAGLRLPLAGLRLPSLKMLERRSISDAFEWLASLEKMYNEDLDSLPETETYKRQLIKARLQRLQERREEFREE